MSIIIFSLFFFFSSLASSSSSDVRSEDSAFYACEVRSEHLSSAARVVHQVIVCEYGRAVGGDGKLVGMEGWWDFLTNRFVEKGLSQ